MLLHFYWRVSHYWLLFTYLDAPGVSHVSSDQNNHQTHQHVTISSEHWHRYFFRSALMHNKADCSLYIHQPVNKQIVMTFILWSPDIWQGPPCSPSRAWLWASCPRWTSSSCGASWPPSWRGSWGCWARSGREGWAARTTGRAHCWRGTLRTCTADNIRKMEPNVKGLLFNDNYFAI